MSSLPTKSSLSAARQRLVEMMQEVPFGRFRNLTIRDGDPLLSPAPVLIKEIKFGADSGPRAERDFRDFDLKSQLVELFAQFDRIKNGTIEVLELKHGLPFRMFVENSQGQPRD